MTVKLPSLFTDIQIETNDSGALKRLDKIRGKSAPRVSYTAEEVYQSAEETFRSIKALLPNVEFRLVESPLELEGILTSMIKTGEVALDVETNTGAKDPDPMLDELAGMSVYTGEGPTYYIPINHSLYEKNIDARDFVKKIVELSKTSVKVIMHNSHFDVPSLYSYSFGMMWVYADTMVASRLLNENEKDDKIKGSGHGLKYLWNKYVMGGRFTSSTYTDLFEKRKFGTFDPVRVHIYAGLDTYMTLTLWHFQREFLDETRNGCISRGLQRVASLFRNLEVPLLNFANEMKITGIDFDMELNRELQVKYEGHIKESRQRLLDIMEPFIENAKPRLSAKQLEAMAPPINLNSSSQGSAMEVFFYDIMQFELSDSLKKNIIRKKIKTRKSDDGGPINTNSVGKDAIKYFTKTYTEHKELFKAYSEYSEYVKIYTSFIIGLRDKVNPITGKIHGSWITTGTKTGRFSAKEPNLQQIPSRNGDIKPQFIPRKGSVFIGNDYS